MAQTSALPLNWQSGGPFGGTVEGLAWGTGPSGTQMQLLAATYGGGIFASDDLGATWTRTDGLTSHFIKCISTSPLSSDILFAGVECREDYIEIENRSALIKSTDGGLTWFESSEGIQNSEWGRSIPFAVAASTTDPDIVYAGCIAFAAPVFYRSADAGSTWTRADTGMVPRYSYSIAVHPAGGDTLLSGSDWRILRSTDGAESWTSTAVPGGPFEALMFLPPDPTVAVAGGADGVHRSTDGGVTWSAVAVVGAPDSTVTCFEYEPFEGILYAGTEGDGLYASADLGATWSQITGPAPPLTLISDLVLATPSRPPYFIAGTEYRGVYTSADGNLWTWSSDGLTASVVRSCEILPDGSILAGIEGLGIARSTDGVSWTYVPDPGEEKTVLCFSVDPAHPDTIYAGSDDATLYLSEDGGETWSSLETFNGPIVGVGVDGQTDGRIYVSANEDSFYVSDDWGLSWTGQLLAGGYSLGLAVNPLDGSHLLVPVGNPLEFCGVYRSTDAGQSWTNVWGGNTANNLAYDASDTSYVYCSQFLDWGLWRSTDEGRTWSMLPSFPVAGRSTVGVEPSEGSVWASTGTKGIVLSVDHGESWLDVSGEIVNRVVNAIGIRNVEDERGERALAVLGTHGGGVYTSRDLPTMVPEDDAAHIDTADADTTPHVVGSPNPFRAEVSLTLAPQQVGPATVRIFSIAGRLVNRVEIPDPEDPIARWDGTDSSGRRVPAGIYFVSVTSGSTVATGKIVHLR